ncbi:MAG: VacJ family lipoprotein [Burkholderiales bacterium]|nr:VacJ family lipoprotein [Burkholderiales bacterium]
MSILAKCRLCAILLAALLFGGCASSGTPGDPFEGFNRAMFGFNEAVDNAVLKPVASGYKTVVPEPARDCVGNVFSNINDIFVGINSLLQGKVGDAVSDVCRVVVNTTVGLLGCFDVASKVGLEKHNRDFGQTFGKWGIGSGPYLVLPFLGPSSVRDGVGTLIYTNLDPVWADHIPTRNVAYSLRAVNRRAELLEASNVLEEAALDKYSFVRDAYLQRRRGMVEENDGKGARSGESQSGGQAAGPTGLSGAVWIDEANQRVATAGERAAVELRLRRQVQAVTPAPVTGRM